MWGQVILWIATTIISYALRPKPPSQPPAGIEDVEVPEAKAGGPIPVLFGTREISGPNVVWYGHLRTQAIKKKGGKK